jgi:type VI secretion system protein ImpA
MPSPPVIDVDSLVAPIPGSSPEGKSVPFPTREKFEKARKEIDPNQFKPDDPQRPSEPQRADWPLVFRLAQETLSQTSKDLLTAARLLESSVKLHGFAGLRDGLQLLKRMIAECWDRVYPPIEEEGDVEVRAAAFFWLDDPDRGARFPSTLQMTALVSDDDNEYSVHVWRLMQKGDDASGPLKAGFEKAVLAAPREYCQNLVDDLEQGLKELDGLVYELNQRMGNAAPGMVGIRQTMGESLVLAQQILSKKGPAPMNFDAAAEMPETVAENGHPAASGPAGPSAPTALNNRIQVYQQIAAAASALRQLEPHSPIPYLLDRAVELGGLPFPELMKVLVRSPDVLNAMNRELGIKEEPAE